MTSALIGGIAGTAAMTALMYIAPMMGFPKMNAAAMLSGMMDMPMMVGWVMHFMIGIIFALGYFYLMNKALPISNNYLRGAAYGVLVFVFAQIMMAVAGMMGMMSAPMEGSMMMMALGSLMGHLVYGAVLGAFVSKEG
ncbi:MAG: hypothetical protein IPP77_09760 [Bacteroidetes bacterium]|nr:hypothetical protein [Bacteroidota bacterium]